MKQLELKLHGNTRRKPERFFPSLKSGRSEYLRLEKERMEELDMPRNLDKGKKYKPKFLRAKCEERIQNQIIEAGEAIDWLVEHGMKESAAFDWVMKRYSPSMTVTSTPSEGLKELKRKQTRSKLPKAA